MTVGSELNKLASNVGVGRDMAGVHWHSDYYQSLFLGQSVAIAMLREIVNTFNETGGSFQFTDFLGNPITIQKA